MVPRKDQRMVADMIVMKLLPALGLLLVLGCATAHSIGRVSSSPWALEVTPLDRSAAQFGNDAAEHLAWAKAYRTRIVEADAPRTIENTLVPYNQMMMHLDAASSDSNLFARVHPNEQVRSAAEESEQAVAKYVTELNLDRRLYESFRDLDVSRADAGTRYLVEKRLRDFRRAGVDKSEDVRKHIAALNDEIVKLGQDFAKNTRNDEREIALDSPSDLEG